MHFNKRILQAGAVSLAVAAALFLAAAPLHAEEPERPFVRMEIRIGDQISTSRSGGGGLSPKSAEFGTIEFGSWDPGNLTDADVNTSGFQPFPNVKDGSGNFVGLVWAIVTNAGTPWRVDTRLLAPLSSGSATIPIESPSLVGPDDNKGGTFRWFTFIVPSEASGTAHLPNNGNTGQANQYSYLTTSNFTTYNSGPDEGNNFAKGGTKAHYGYFILVPSDQVQGNYAGEVQFTFSH